MRRQPPISTLFPYTTLFRSIWTRPAPLRSADVPASTGAPIMPSFPPTTSTRPNVPLCPSRGRGGSAGGEVMSCRTEEHTSELQSRQYLVCRLLLDKNKSKQH